MALKKVSMTYFSLLGAFLLWASLGQAQERRVWVNQLIGSDANDGLSQATPKETVQGGFDICETNDLIMIEDGVYFESPTLTSCNTVWIRALNLGQVTLTIADQDAREGNASWSSIGDNKYSYSHARPWVIGYQDAGGEYWTLPELTCSDLDDHIVTSTSAANYNVPEYGYCMNGGNINARFPNNDDPNGKFVMIGGPLFSGELLDIVTSDSVTVDGLIFEGVGNQCIDTDTASEPTHIRNTQFNWCHIGARIGNGSTVEWSNYTYPGYFKYEEEAAELPQNQSGQQEATAFVVQKEYDLPGGDSILEGTCFQGHSNDDVDIGFIEADSVFDGCKMQQGFVNSELHHSRFTYAIDNGVENDGDSNGGDGNRIHHNYFIARGFDHFSIQRPNSGQDTIFDHNVVEYDPAITPFNLNQAIKDVIDDGGSHQGIYNNTFFLLFRDLFRIDNAALLSSTTFLRNNLVVAGPGGFDDSGITPTVSDNAAVRSSNPSFFTLNGGIHVTDTTTINFIDEANGNYGITSGSILEDIGTTITDAGHDVTFGFLGSAPDAGAFEVGENPGLVSTTWPRPPGVIFVDITIPGWTGALPPTSSAIHGPLREIPHLSGTTLTTADAWQTTLESGSGVFLMRAGTYNISGTLDLDNITVFAFNQEDVLFKGKMVLDDNAIVAGIRLDADDVDRCIEVENDNAGDPIEDVIIRNNEIFGGDTGGCIRIRGNVTGLIIEGNHVDGAAGPNGTSGHTIDVKGGCGRSGDDETTPFTYGCAPENYLIEHNLVTKNVLNHSWADHGDSEDGLQFEGAGSGTVRRNQFFEITDSRHEEYVDVKTPASGATIIFEENWFRGQGLAPGKSCMIVQGDWNPGQLIVRDNLFEQCGQVNNRHALHAGGIKSFDDINIEITGNIFKCFNTTGGLQFGDLSSFVATGNTIDSCNVNGATISASTNAFADWQGTHLNGASNTVILTAANGDFSLFNNVAVPPPLPPTGDPIRVETEDMTLSNGWAVISRATFSGGEGVSGSGTGTINAPGPSGLYEISVGYLDEDDGISSLDVSVAGNLEGTILYDLQTGVNAVKIAVASVQIDVEDEIRLDCTANAGEPCRTDFITLQPLGEPPPPPVALNDIVGLNQTAADASLAAQGFIVGVVTTANDPVVPVDDVISSNPVAGTLLALGAAVDYVLSLGPATPPPPPASGAFFVAKTGSDANTCAQAQSQSTPRLTIQAGVNCLLAPGDSLEVKAGTYNEAVDITTAANGTVVDPVIIKNFGVDVVLLQGDGVDPGGAFDGLIDFAGSVSYMHIEGIDIDVGTTTESNTPNISMAGGPDHIYLKDMILTSAKDVAIDGSDNGTPASFITLENLDVSGWGGFLSTFFRGGNNISITGGRYADPTTVGNIDGVGLTNVNRGLIESTEVEGACDGIDIGGGPSFQQMEFVIVRNNDVHDNGGGGCTSTRATGINSGTNVTGHINNSYIGNTVHDNGVSIVGEIYTSTQQTEIWNNTFVGPRYWVRGGCFGDGTLVPDGVKMFNNIYVNSNPSEPVIEQWNIEDVSTFNRDYNIYTSGDTGSVLFKLDPDGNDNGVLCSDPGIIEYDDDSAGFAALQLLGEDANSLRVDPLLDPSFVPTAGSPAIDAGTFMMTVTGTVTSDTFGVSKDPHKFFVAPGDFYQVGGDNLQIEGVGVFPIVSMTSTTITIDQSVSVIVGDGVHYPYSDNAPDIGAKEVVAAPPPPDPDADVICIFCELCQLCQNTCTSP